jgi:ABC-type proline/glycine betaine transport system permease subunit
MILAPDRTRLAGFLLLVLGPAITLPSVALLFAAIGSGPPALAFLTIYVFPPLILAHAIGIGNQSSSVYSSPLFEGYIGIGPTPLGFVFCTGVWLFIGYASWFLFVGIRSNPVPSSGLKGKTIKNPEDY